MTREHEKDGPSPDRPEAEASAARVTPTHVARRRMFGALVGLAGASALSAVSSKASASDDEGDDDVNGILGEDGLDLHITPGAHLDDDGDPMAGTRRNVILDLGNGNPNHNNQAGAFVVSTGSGAVCDWHGVGVSTDDERVNRWVFGFGGVGNNYPFDVDVDTNFFGVYSFNCNTVGAAVQVVLSASSQIGFRVYDVPNARSAFQVNSKGVSYGSTIDAAQTGAHQWITVAQAGTPAAGKGWFWFDGTSFCGKNAAGDSLVMLRVNAAGETLIDLGAVSGGRSAAMSLIAGGGTLFSISQIGAQNVQLQAAGGFGLTLKCAKSMVLRSSDGVIHVDAGTSYVNVVGSTLYVDVSDCLLVRSADGRDEFFRVGPSGWSFGEEPPTPTRTLSGDKEGNVALANLIAILAEKGILVDATT